VSLATADLGYSDSFWCYPRFLCIKSD